MDLLILFIGWPLVAIVGAASLFVNPFSMAYAITTGLTYRLISRTMNRQVAVMAIGIATALLWSTLLLSETKIEYRIIPEHSAPIEKAGFPFTVFQYPFPPMGGDLPPLRMWPLFFSNYALWLIPGIAISFLIARKTRLSRHAHQFLLAFIVVAGLWGLGHTVLKFD